MKYKIRVYIQIIPIILLSCAFLKATSQSQVSFNHFNTAHGLSNGNVLSIFKDSEGIMWFGTEDGLNKYNGTSFEVFSHNPDDANSISSSIVFSVFEDSELNLWVQTHMGLNRYDRKNNNFIPLNVEDSIIGCKSCILHTSDLHEGKIWSWNNGSVFRYDTKEKKIDLRTDSFLNSSLIEGKEIFNIALDDYNRLWLADRMNFYFIDLNKKAFFKLKVDGVDEDFQARIVHQKPTGEIWMETFNGFLVLNGKDLSLKAKINTLNSNISGDQITDIEFDQQNNIWIATNSGLNLLTDFNYQKQNYDFEVYLAEANNPSSIQSNIIESIYADNENRIWLGSRFGGVDVLDRNLKQFNYIGLNTGENLSLSGQIVTDMERGVNNELFIANDGGGIDVWNYEQNKIISMAKYAPFANLGNKKVLALCLDASKRLWVGYWDGGIDILDFKRKLQIHLEKGEGNLDLSSNSIFTLEKDSRNNIWIGTYTGGLNLWNHQSNTITHFPVKRNDAQSTTGSTILCVYEDSEGKIWVGQDPGGLNCYHYNSNTFTHYAIGTESNSYNDMVLSVFEDSKKRMWLGYRGKGLVQFNPNTEAFTVYDDNDGLPNNSVYTILEDNDSNLWVSTNVGLSKISFDKDEASKLSFTNYDVNDGLQSNQFSLWSEMKLDNGTLIFGGVNGFNYFKPQQIKNEQRIHNVIFTEFAVFNRPVSHILNPEIIECHMSVCKKAQLNHKQGVFSIEFTATNYTEPETNRYLCKLEGFDKEWRELHNENKVTYTNLDPGNYTFKVLGSNMNGYWGDNPTELQITILPAWWETIYFRLAAIVLLLLLAIAIARLRLRKLEQRNRRLNELVLVRTEEISEKNTELRSLNEELQESNKTKDKLFSIIAHDLRSPFNNILGFTEYLSESYYELDDERRVDIISKIGNSSERVFNLLSNLLVWARSQLNSIKVHKQQIQLNDIVNNVSAVQYDSLKKKELSLTIENVDFEIDFDATHIEIILNNLLSNAIKYSFRDNKIAILGANINGIKTLSIKDFGTGMSKEIVNNLFSNTDFDSELGTESEKGTGLGLKLVKDLLEKNKATIHVDSEPEKGTCFIIQFS